MPRYVRFALLAPLGLSMFALSMTSVVAFAEQDKVSVGKDIVVADDASADDIVCVLCSVKVHSEVKGDIVTVLGSVTVDDGRPIDGDMVTLGGNVELGDGASIQGDLVTIGGDLEKGAGATVHGDSTILLGRGWLLVPFAPLLILIGVVWLIVWLVNRRRYQLRAYPEWRGL